MHSCQINPEKSYTEKKIKHTPSGYSLYTNYSFDETKTKLDGYKGEECMERFCKDLREHAMKIINFEEKEMIRKISFMKSRKFVTYAKKNLVLMKMVKMNLNRKVRDHCRDTAKFRGAAHSICNLRYKTLKEMLVVFHNGSTDDCCFIINKLAKEFYGQLECLGENTEKYITFSVPISKELHNGKNVTYRLKFIDLCQPHYQVLLIIYQKNTIVISVKIVNLNLIICQSKVIN